MLKQYSNRLIYTLTFIVLSLIVLWINPETLLNELLHLGIWGALVLMGIYLVDLSFRTYRWKVLLRAQGVDLPMKSLALPVISALTLNLFTIARAGETVRLHILKKNYNTKYADTLSSILIEQVLSVISLLMVIIGSLIVIGGSLQQTPSSSILQSLIFLLFIFTSLILLLLAVFSWRSEMGMRLINLFPAVLATRLSSVYRSFLLGVADLRSTPSLLIKGLVTSISIWILEGIMLFVVASSVFPLFSLIDLPWAISASAAGNITFFLPVLPGSIGAYEAIVTLVLINAPNYPGTFATLVAVIDRVIKTVILVFLGGYAIIELGGNELIRISKTLTPPSFKDMSPEEDGKTS